MKKIKISTVLTALTLSLATGCAVGPAYRRPDMNMQSAYAVQLADMVDAVSSDLGWWEIVNDDVVLKSLVMDAIEKNHDLFIALSRMKEARALAGIKLQTPTVEMNAGIQRSATKRPGESAVNENHFSTGVGVSWELDIWGKVRHGQEAALAQYLASEQGRRAVFLALIGDVVGGYYQLQALDMQLATARRTVESRKHSLSMAEKRWEQGVADKLETNQAASALAQAQAALPGLTQAVHAQENQLNLLLGRMPGPIPRGNSLQDLPPKSITPGIPSDLLERRPDIRQKEELLRYANAQVGVATASRLPSFSLTGSLGLQSSTLADLVKSPNFSLGGSLLAPILNGGALKNQEEAAVERFQQVRADYEKAVISALCDVSNALVGVAESKTAVKAQKEVLRTLRETEFIATKRFEHGLSPYLEVLDAQRQLFTAELSFAEALCDQQRNVIKLYLALGGGWNQPDRPKKP